MASFFEETSACEIARLITAHPLAVMCCTTAQGLVAHHIPMRFKEKKALVGHIAIAHGLHASLDINAPVLLVFRGEDAYISPNLYPTKKVTHRHVPTWNYQAVHVHGRISFSHDEKDKMAVVGQLTKHFELRDQKEKQWTLSDAPRDYLHALLEKIVAFTVRVEKITAISKVSQNQQRIDFEQVMHVMHTLGKKELASRMERMQLNTD